MPNLSRRSLVTSARRVAGACRSGRRRNAQPYEPDLIFAAIEKYRALDAAFIARCHYEDDLAESGHEPPPAPGEYSRTAEMVAAVNALRAVAIRLSRNERNNTVIDSNFRRRG
jgi:hypothetical protein